MVEETKEVEQEQPKQTINIDGKVYDLDSLSDAAKRACAQIEAIQHKLNQLQVDADQLAMAKSGFISILKQEINPPKPEPISEENTDAEESV